MGCDTLSSIDLQVDQCRQHHAANRSDAGECGLLDRAQQSPKQLALEFDPHQQEKEHHQPVVDPQDQRLVDAQGAHMH